MVCAGALALISLQMSCDRIDKIFTSRITLYWNLSKNVARWDRTRSKASKNDRMGGTCIVCRLHNLVNENCQQELGCHSSEIADRSIDYLVALSSIFAKWVNLQWGIVAFERGWHPETEPSVLDNQMALRQLLLRFSATDHDDCHFREEILEKVTVPICKRREPAQ